METLSRYFMKLFYVDSSIIEILLLTWITLKKRSITNIALLPQEVKYFNSKSCIVKWRLIKDFLKSL